MLDKAGRQADGPPTEDPGSTASGRGTGFLRRRWNRAVHPLSGAVRRAGRSAAVSDESTPPIADPVDHGGIAHSGRRPSLRAGPKREPRAQSPDIEPVSEESGDDPTGELPGEQRISLERAAAAGGGLVIAPGWRERAAAAPRAPGHRLRAAYRWIRRSTGDLLRRRPTRADLADLIARRPTTAEITAAARRHRALIGILLLTVLLAAGDGSASMLVTDRPPAPGVAYRVPVAHPLRLSTPIPSVRRYLDAIDNGERLREQAVVAAAARATLERAKAEAAAAVAGQEQPWINNAPAPGGIIPPGAVPPGTGGYVLPAPGTFTSGFGSRWGTFHRGIDIAGPIGTPIYAVASGTVIDAGPAAGFGLWVRIRHDDGAISVYGHMYDFFVSVGERVPAGMQIARMGNRGDSTGPHLHFEIISNGQHVDPQSWLALHGLSYN